MMKKPAWLLLLLIVPLLAQAQEHRSPYAGRQAREIKALSADEVQSYLEGQGIQLALAAELNDYPGPLHTLELAGPLQLTTVQEAQTEKVRAAVLAEAKKLGKLIVEKEKELDGLFSSGNIDEVGLRTLVGEIARLQGELRIAHLRRHLEMKRILTPEQVKRYDELRGYGEAGAEHEGRAHGKE
jgi:Spy/CpxP family protein refolding chaperone